MANGSFCVSTDIVGVFGGVDDWIDVYGSVMKHPNFGGVEMLGWKGTAKRIDSYQKEGIATVGIHGQTGGAKETKGIVGKVMLGGINSIMDSPKALAACPTEYLLFHVKSDAVNHIGALPPEKIILIENDLDADSLEKTRKRIRKLQKKHIKAGMMFDLVHYLRSQYGYTNVAGWDKMLGALEGAAPWGIHLPIGLHLSDSLPVEQISQRMWKELGGVLLKIKPRFKTIENQMERRYSLSLPKSERAAIRSRNNRIIDLLTNAGVL